MSETKQATQADSTQTTTTTTSAPAATSGQAPGAQAEQATKPQADSTQTTSPASAQGAEAPPSGEQTQTQKTNDDGTQAKTGSAPGDGQTGQSGPLELKLPEGSPLPPARVDEILAQAKERGWNQDTAQAVLNAEHQAVTAFAERTKSEWNQRVNGWLDEAKADPQIGGQHFEKTTRLAKAIVESRGDAELKQFLNETGLGNHKAVIRFLAKWAQEVGQDTFEVSQQQSSGATKSPGQVFYPNMNP